MVSDDDERLVLNLGLLTLKNDFSKEKFNQNNRTALNNLQIALSNVNIDTFLLAPRNFFFFSFIY